MSTRTLVKSYGFCLLFVGICQQAGAGINCTEERATIELLHSQEIPFIDPNCSNPPSITVNWDYRCTRCEEPSPPDKHLTGTGFGQCDGLFFCAPYYIGEFQEGSNKMRMKIQNQAIVGNNCRDHSVTAPLANCFCPSPHTCDITPIVISIYDREVDMTSAECGVDFDLNSDGVAEALSWTAPGADEAFLFLDRNNNGIVDDGTELFGNYTPQPPGERNGFNALKLFDKPVNGGNEDGLINQSDRIYRHLGLWIDNNHNGFSETEELYSLGQLDIEGIDLAYRKSTKTDRHGNEFRFWSHAYLGGVTSQSREAWDVFLVLGTSERSRVFEKDCSL